MMSGSREKLEELKQKVSELEEQLEREQARSGSPKFGQRYWYITSNGGVEYSKWDDHQVDHDRLAFGNVYLSYEEAIKAQQQKLAEVRVITRLRELDGGFVADWGDENQSKYCVHFDHAQKGFFIDVWQVCQFCPPGWTSTQEAWDQVIQEMPEDIKLMMGVDS